MAEYDGEKEDLDEVGQAAWRKMAHAVMSLEALNTLECPPDWVGLSEVTSRVRTLKVRGNYPDEASARRRLNNVLWGSFVEEVHVFCHTHDEKEKYDEQILISKSLREFATPRLPPINKYHIEVACADENDPRLTVALMRSIEDLSVPVTCLADLSDDDLRAAASSTSLKTLTFSEHAQNFYGELMKYSVRQLLVKGTELSWYVAAKWQNQRLQAFALGKSLIFERDVKGNRIFTYQMDALGEACANSWAGTDTYKAVARVDRYMSGLVRGMKENVFRDHTWKRAEEALKITRSEHDVQKRYDSVVAAIGKDNFLYPEDWKKVGETLKNDFNQLIDNLTNKAPTVGKRKAEQDLPQDAAKLPKT